MTKPAYKMTEIGEIPEDWNLDKISNLIKSIYYGITAKSTDQKSILRFLRTTDIKNFRFSEKDLPYCKITESKQNLLNTSMAPEEGVL